MIYRTYFLLVIVSATAFFSCKDDDQSGDADSMEMVDNIDKYEFFRDNEGTVSFTGQIERANMLSAIKTYLLSGDAGQIIEATTLKQAYNNTDNDGGGLFDFSSTKQLRDKTFQPDLDDDYFGDLFEQAAIASKAGNSASEGQPGLIERESKGTSILVNNKGHEFTQFIEKGLMGSVFLNQVYNTYLTDARTGDDVDNESIVEGKNYTLLEHHWDEAFGYFTAPGDFGSDWPELREDEVTYWSKYANVVDPFIGSNDKIMNAFRQGRAAIVAKDNATKNINKNILYKELELVAAGTAIHYINQSISALNKGNTGDLLHVLSEAAMFTRALTFSPQRKITPSDLHNIQNVDFGIEGNFWMVSAEGLNNAKNKIIAAYPSLEVVKDEL